MHGPLHITTQAGQSPSMLPNPACMYMYVRILCACTAKCMYAHSRMCALIDLPHTPAPDEPEPCDATFLPSPHHAAPAAPSPATSTAVPLISLSWTLLRLLEPTCLSCAAPAPAAGEWSHHTHIRTPTRWYTRAYVHAHRTCICMFILACMHMYRQAQRLTRHMRVYACMHL